MHNLFNENAEHGISWSISVTPRLQESTFNWWELPAVSHQADPASFPWGLVHIGWPI